MFNKCFRFFPEILEQQGGHFFSIKILEDATKAESLTNNGTPASLANASKFTSQAQFIAIMSKVHETLVSRFFIAALDHS